MIILTNFFTIFHNGRINDITISILFSPTYSVDKERIGPGCKWSLAQLKSYLHQVMHEEFELSDSVKPLLADAKSHVLEIDLVLKSIH